MHTLRCVIGDIHFEGIFGPAPNQEQTDCAFSSSDVRWAARRDTGLHIAVNRPCKLTQKCDGMPDHVLVLDVGTHVVVFSRDGNALVIDYADSADTGGHAWISNTSIDALRKSKEE